MHLFLWCSTPTPVSQGVELTASQPCPVILTLVKRFTFPRWIALVFVTEEPSPQRTLTSMPMLDSAHFF